MTRYRSRNRNRTASRNERTENSCDMRDINRGKFAEIRIENGV